jgi:DNA-binding NarL/FixJ family response regulator
MLVASLVVISACEIFFVLDVLDDIFVFGIPLLNWFDHTAVEIFVTIALGFAISTIVHNIRSLLQHQRHIEETVQAASGHLHEVIAEYFKQWKLTPSEKEVAMLLFKGFSTQEIADLRNTKIGTVKNQSSSIYQKAEVKNRNELFALFVEELLGNTSISI